MSEQGNTVEGLREEESELVTRLDFLLAARLCISTDENRVYLSGIYAEPVPTGGVNLIASDGYVLCVIFDPDGVCKGPSRIWAPNWKFLEANDIKNQSWTGVCENYVHMKINEMEKTNKIRFFMGAPGEKLPLDPEGVSKEWNTINSKLALDKDCPFPDWKRLIPDLRKMNSPEKIPARADAGMSPDILMQVCKFAKTLKRSEKSGKGKIAMGEVIRLWIPEWKGSWCATFSEKAFMIFMPRRCEESEGKPDWLQF